MEIFISVVAVLIAVSCLYFLTASDLKDYFKRRAAIKQPKR
jgi:hypothetical protein